MAILSKPRFLPQQRLDLEDINALLAALRTDSKLYTKQFLSQNNLIYKGFTVTGIGLKSATVAMADATLIIPQNTNDFSWFTSSPTEPNVTIPDADLTDGTRNYVEIALTTENNTPLTKAFWDPEANSGLGSEFNQIVETINDLKCNFVVSTGGFSGSPDRLPLCIIDVDGSGNIKTIFDRRILFGRLAKPADLDNRFAWGTKLEPTYALTLTGVTGTFIAGETLTINTETAKCTTGGTTAIAFNVPTGINFFPGSTVTGGTSGATGTVNTIAESFTGVDKNLKGQKDINDALMTEFALVKGTRFWWENANSSISGIVKFLESVLVQATPTGKFAWDGTELKITDDNVTPGNDTLGYIRMMGRGDDIGLTREDGTGGTSPIAIDDGEVLYVKIPATGDRLFSASGSGSTNYQTVDIASYQSSDENYWLAYREGTRLYIRGYGELEPGEEINIGDPELEDILASIAANLASANQDRTMKLIEGGTWSLNLDGDELTLSDDAFIQIPGLLQTRNQIDAQTISLPNPTSVAYVEINRSGATPDSLTVVVADEDDITPIGNDVVVIARRVSDGVLVGSHSFLLQPGELLTLEGALAEINRYMGQLKIKRHETDLDKARVNPADALLLNGNTLSQVIDNFLLDFSGALINFTTGVVTKEDGVTALGTNFTPFSIPVGEYFWYGISLNPGDVGVNNTQAATLQIDPADAANAVQANALRPVITGSIKLGAIQVRNNGGNIEVVDLKPLGVGSGSGGGSGQGASFDAEIRAYVKLSDYEFAELNIFPVDQKTKIDLVNSTGAYAPATKTFKMTVGQTMQSIELLDPDFIAATRSLAKARVILRYASVAKTDTDPTVEISKNSGAFEEVTMSRIGGTDTWDGEIELDAAAGTSMILKVTSSMTSEIYAYGVLYDTTFTSVPLGQQKHIQAETFLGDLNKTNFPLNFTPDPSTLVVYDKTRGQSYIYDPANTFAISGNSVVFVSDFFNFPGETIKLEFRQIVGNGFDNSDQNAVSIAEQNQNLLDLGEDVSSFNMDSVVLTNKVVAPFTTIVNRAQVTDASQDLLPKFGPDRITCQQCYPIMNEFGPNGQAVFGLVNDKYNMVRMVGNWLNTNDSFGSRPTSAVVDDYLEITYYGTGLNVLLEMGTPLTDLRASIDGAAEVVITKAVSVVLSNRNYKVNQVWPVVSNQSLGWHTVKIRSHAIGAYVLNFHGFEVLTESSTGLIRLSPGTQVVKGKRRTNPTLSTTPYNSTFESGVLGTRGGRVLIYQKSDGTIAKAVTPTEASTLTLLNANHGNEEIARVYRHDEFGAHRTDGFDSMANAANGVKAFTLDDAVTTLSGGTGNHPLFIGNKRVLGLNGTAGVYFLDFTFVGTGCDVVLTNDANTGSSDTIEAYVDGVSVGNIRTGTPFLQTRRFSVVSGLPYGTHVVRLLRTGGGTSTCYLDTYITYQPKTPTLPAGAVALGAYNIPANFVANTVGSPSNLFNALSTGVIRRQATRDMLYVGTWSISSVNETFIPGFSVSSTTPGDYVETTFYGTGFDLRAFMSTAGTGNVQLTLDGSITNFTPYTTSFAGPAGTGFTAATGIIDGSASAGSGFASTCISGLPLGVHTIRATIVSTGLVFCCFDLITPIHTQKANGPKVLQNVLTVGGCGIEDLRTFNKKDVKVRPNTSEAFSVNVNPATTSTVPVPLPDMSLTHFSKTGRIKITYNIQTSNSSIATSIMQLLLNGLPVGQQKRNQYQSGGAGTACTTSDSFTLDVPIGANKLDVFWATTAGNHYVLDGATRTFLVEDVE